MESPSKKKKSEHHSNADEYLNPFSPFPTLMGSPFGLQNATPLTAFINDGGITPFLAGMTPSVTETQLQVPSSRDWTPTMREGVPDGFDLQHAMSPPINGKQRNRGKRNSAGGGGVGNSNAAAGLVSPLFPDLINDNDQIFDSEAQSHLNKNRQALANRIRATEKPNLPLGGGAHPKKSNGNNYHEKRGTMVPISLGDMQSFSNTSLLNQEEDEGEGDEDHPHSGSTLHYKYGIAEQFSTPLDTLSQNSDHSGLAAITAAAETVQRLNPLPENPPIPLRSSLEIATDLPSPIVKTAISHPKKQRLKVKEEGGSSAPASPFKTSVVPPPPAALSQVLSFPSSAVGGGGIAPFSRNNSTNSIQPMSLNSSSTPFRAASLSSLEDKARVEEMLRAGIQRAQQLRADDSKLVTCNCKKSKCLKMYCDCFRLTEYCKKTCNCFECNNLEAYEEARKTAIRSITERNPEAFKPRVTEEVGAGGSTASKGHLTGCHCRKSACLKKYCECFTGNVPCTARCRCLECKNVAELYTLDENMRRQAFALTAAAISAATTAAQQAPPSSGSKKTIGLVGSSQKSVSSSSLFSPSSSSAGGAALAGTRLNFSHDMNSSSGGPNNMKLQVVESDLSNLTTSTLYSTDGGGGEEERGRSGHNNSNSSGNGSGSQKLSIEVTPDRLNPSKYKAMTSPELREINAASRDSYPLEYRNTVDSVESTASTAHTVRSSTYSAPSSPLRSVTKNNANDAMLSPIKLLELADVCSERQSQEEQELKLSQQSQQSTSRSKK